METSLLGKIFFFLGTSCGAPDGGSGEAATAVAVNRESPVYLGIFLINGPCFVHMVSTYCLSTLCKVDNVLRTIQ